MRKDSGGSEAWKAVCCTAKWMVLSRKQRRNIHRHYCAGVTKYAYSCTGHVLHFFFFTFTHNGGDDGRRVRKKLHNPLSNDLLRTKASMITMVSYTTVPPPPSSYVAILFFLSPFHFIQHRDPLLLAPLLFLFYWVLHARPFSLHNPTSPPHCSFTPTGRP